MALQWKATVEPKVEVEATVQLEVMCGRGYVWYTGNYTAIKLTMKDWKEFFPHYLSQPVQAPQEIHEQFD
jgi:hypothetical protein